MTTESIAVAASPATAPRGAEGAYREALRTRLLRNERAYGAFLAAFGGGSACAIWLGRLSGEMPQEVYERGDPTLSMSVVLGLVCIYGAALRGTAARALARQADPKLGWMAARTMFELSVAAVVFLVESRGFPWPHYVLFGPQLGGLALLVAASGLRMSPAISLVAGFGAGGVWLVLSGYLQSASAASPLPEAFRIMPPHVVQALMLMGLGGVMALISGQLRSDVESTLRAVEERQRIRHTFGQHVSPRVAEALLADHEASATRTRPVTVMFLDVRGFTTFSETRSPVEVVEALDAIFAVAVRCIDAHGGIVNKFLGDGLLAAFGAPVSSGSASDDAKNAVRAGERILAELDAAVAAGRAPALEVGIGIHSGEAVAGTVGTEDRREYTLIGDAVNLASRIEGLNRELGARLLVSEATWSLAGRTEPVGVHEAAVKGRQQRVRVHQLA